VELPGSYLPREEARASFARGITHRKQLPTAERLDVFWLFPAKLQVAAFAV
jgi:hypothetical protein